jgi:hypothetical protein
VVQAVLLRQGEEQGSTLPEVDKQAGETVQSVSERGKQECPPA